VSILFDTACALQVYLGFESGSPEMLKRIQKGATVQALEVCPRAVDYAVIDIMPFAPETLP
jgi:radical SAM superfamily enzyme YgiQ (UPF0313 family)